MMVIVYNIRQVSYINCTSQFTKSFLIYSLLFKFGDEHHFYCLDGEIGLINLND